MPSGAVTISGLESREATSSDGYSGGIKLFRDTYLLSGGQRGNVATGLMVRTRTGKGQTGFEWAVLGLLDNYSDAGENVAVYAQANSFGLGPSWGLVAECNNHASLLSPCVGAEINIGTTGRDTGNRIGLDVVLVDGALNRGLSAASTVEATAGLRIGTALNSPQALWKYGVKLEGGMQRGLDTTTAKTNAAIVLREGQHVAFTADGRIRMDFSNGAVRLLRDNVVVHSFPMQ